MSSSDTASMPKSATGAFVVGLLLLAAVPGTGYFYGQFVETIVLCAGGAALVYAALATFMAINRRLDALERRLR